MTFFFFSNRFREIRVGRELDDLRLQIEGNSEKKSMTYEATARTSGLSEFVGP